MLAQSWMSGQVRISLLPQSQIRDDTKVPSALGCYSRVFKVIHTATNSSSVTFAGTFDPQSFNNSAATSASEAKILVNLYRPRSDSI